MLSVSQHPTKGENRAEHSTNTNSYITEGCQDSKCAKEKRKKETDHNAI